MNVKSYDMAAIKKKNPVLFNLMVGTLPSIAPANQETFSFISYGGKKGQLLL